MEYCGNVVYENGTAKRVLTEVGYVTLSDKKPHCYLQDHQGNNRVVINESGSVEEVNHYYEVSPYIYCTNDPVKNVDSDGR